MHFLFIYERFNMGGVQTLIARMSKWLLEHQHSVTLLLEQKGDAMQLLPGSVKVFSFDNSNGLYSASNYRKALSMLSDTLAEPIDVIFAFSCSALPLSLFLSSRHSSRPNIVSGVFNPWQYCYNRIHFFTPFNLVVRLFDRTIPDENKLFMSEQIRHLHEIDYRRSLQKARVWPLPIDFKMFSGTERKPIHGKIVSIGRLNDMKLYNFYMIDVVKELLQRGYKVTYDIYGEGPFGPKMEEKIRSNNLERYIHLRGRMEYHEMGKNLSDAFVFVGMGTALIEAGGCGVPSIVAIANFPDPLTYGFLDDLPFGACGELLDTPPTIRIADAIAILLDSSDQQYEICSKGTRTAAMRYDSEEIMQSFLVYCEKANHCHPPFWIYLLSMFFRAYKPLRSIWIWLRRRDLLSKKN